MSQDFYVYLHRKSTTGEVFYVGKGVGLRAWKTAGRGRSWHNTAKKHGLIVEIAASGLQEWYAHELEQDLIALHGRRDLGYGPLVNLTDGGEGAANPSPEARARLSAVRSGKEKTEAHRQAIKESLTGRRLSAEHRAAVSKGAAGRKLSAQHVDAIRRSKQGKRLSESHRMALSHSLTGKIVTESHRMALRAAIRADRARSVSCIETGKVFETILSAREWLKANGSPLASHGHIWSTCNGLRKSAYGYTWRYADKPLDGNEKSFAGA